MELRQRAGARPLRASSLADGVHDALRDAIVAGDVAPGEQLNEVRIGEALGVSRTPVREALRRLAETDLVRLDVGRSYRAATVDPARLRSVLAVFGELTGMAARLARPRLTEDDVAWVEEARGHLLQDLEATAAGGPRSGFGRDLLDLLLERADEPVLTEAVSAYRPHLQRLLNLVVAKVDASALTEWGAGVVAAVGALEPDVLGVAVRTYTVRVGEALLAALPDPG